MLSQAERKGGEGPSPRKMYFWRAAVCPLKGQTRIGAGLCQEGRMAVRRRWTPAPGVIVELRQCREIEEP